MRRYRRRKGATAPDLNDLRVSIIVADEIRQSPKPLRNGCGRHMAVAETSARRLRTPSGTCRNLCATVADDSRQSPKTVRDGCGRLSAVAETPAQRLRTTFGKCRNPSATLMDDVLQVHVTLNIAYERYAAGGKRRSYCSCTPIADGERRPYRSWTPLGGWHRRPYRSWTPSGRWHPAVLVAHGRPPRRWPRRPLRGCRVELKLRHGGADSGDHEPLPRARTRLRRGRSRRDDAESLVAMPTRHHGRNHRPG